MARFAVLILLALLPLRAYAAESNDCPTPINGPLKGEAGNNQDAVFHSLAIDPTDANTVYIGTEGDGVFKTTDGGATWTRLRNGLKCTISHSFYSQIFDIAVDPVHPQTLYASAINGPGPASPVTYPSASGGVYKSTDGGATWVQKNNGLASTYVTYVLVDGTTSNRVYAVVGGLVATYPTFPGPFIDGGIYVSTDGAETWSPLTLPTGVNTNIFINAVIRGSDHRMLYASGQIHKGEAPTAYGLLRSTDAGASWAIANPPGETVSGFDVFKANPNIIYANVASGHRAWTSVDGGASWTAVGPQIFFGVMRVHPTNSLIAYYTGGVASIYKTIDGFGTTQQVYNDTTVAADQIITDIRIANSNPNVVWAAGNGYYLYRSTDAGLSWSKITAVRAAMYGAASVDLGNVPITTIAPVKFSSAAKAFSYLRVYNPGTTTGMLQVDVRDELGTLLGTFNREIAPGAAPQISMAAIEAEAHVTVPTRSGAFAQWDVKANFNGFAQHVVYDTTLGVLTNLSLCRSSATGASAASVSTTSATNVHSTLIAAIPSRIVLSNGDSVAASVQLDVSDAATGTVVGRWTSPLIPAGGAAVVSVAQIQSEMGFTPTASQLHLNLNLVGTSRITMSHYADNISTGVQADMSQRCEFRATAN